MNPSVLVIVVGPRRTSNTSPPPCTPSGDFPVGTFPAFPEPLSNDRITSTSRFHGAPQVGHAPRSLVPALMHGSTSASGNVAKCASLRLGRDRPDGAEVSARR